VKPLLMILVTLFVAGCNTTTIYKRTYINVVQCSDCSAAPCEHCQQSQHRQTRCTAGRIQGDFGQVFRVECPSGRVTPEVTR